MEFLLSLLASQGRKSERRNRKIARRLVRDSEPIRSMIEAGGVKLDLIDIKRAHLNAEVLEPGSPRVGGAL